MREEEKRERTEVGSLASESETTSVYSVRVRRISSADKTDRASGARCEFRMYAGVTRSSLCDRVVRCTFCIRSQGVARVQTGPFRRSYRIASHRVASVFLQALEMKSG